MSFVLTYLKVQFEDSDVVLRFRIKSGSEKNLFQVLGGCSLVKCVVAHATSLSFQKESVRQEAACSLGVVTCIKEESSSYFVHLASSLSPFSTYLRLYLHR